jgi:PAS domain S-box-containing protein
VTTVDRPPSTAPRLGSRLGFEARLAELTTRFINVSPDGLDREIEDTLRRLCEWHDFDLAALWQASSDGLPTSSLTHVARTIGEPALPDRMDAREHFPWTQDEVLARRTVVLSRLDDVPAEAARDLATLRHFGVKSALSIPLSAGGGPVFGGLNFARIREEKAWSNGLVEQLQLVAQVFANALAHRRHELRLRASEARLASGADLAGLGYYEVDWARRLVYVDDRFRDICGMPADVPSGLGPVDFWRAHQHPDDRDRMAELRERQFSGAVDRLSAEYRYLHPTRGEIWLHHLSTTAERDAAGRTTRTYGVLRDITAQKQAEEALRQSYAEIERLKDKLQAESDYLKAEIGLAYAHGEIVGRSAAIKQVLRQVEQVAPTDSTVLIQGETGTGKELVAQAIHRLSARRTHVLVKVNCAALPSGLVESELFGREKGAFTGALTRQVGRFEIADGSTIFLDEIGELSLEVQAKLLRVLEAGEFERLGSPRTLKVNVRVIAATNRDLAEEIRKGRFREDLYYRLSVFPIRVPTLRERVEDIPLLVWAFLGEVTPRMGKKITQVPRTTMDALMRRPWPGNVRELRNVIEHGAIVTGDDTLRIPALTDTPAGSALPQTLADAERAHILGTLERTGWRIKGPAGAAAALGLKPSTLYSRMKKLGIHLPASNGRHVAS